MGADNVGAMRPRLIAATAAIALLALTGCSSGMEINATTSDSTPVVEESTASTPAPLVAETTEAPAESATDTPEAQFVAIVRDTWTKMATETQIPNATDEQLIDAGHKACEQLAADPKVDSVRVVDGEEPDGAGYFIDSGVIAGAAVRTLCTEITPSY